MKRKLRLTCYLAFAWVVFGFLAVIDAEVSMAATVPDLIGLSQAKAQSEIVAAGLVLGTMTRASSGTVPLGDIIIQSPTAGISVNTGTTVNLVISAGPAKFFVPDVVGLIQADAQDKITTAKLVAVGNVALASSGTVPIGNVISQDPLAETAVTQGFAVRLIVSSGPP